MDLFRFKYFDINQTGCAMKVGTDSLVLGSWEALQVYQPKSILDIGCGTGVLSFMMAQRFPSSVIHAIEIDEIAANRASENFNANTLGKHCKVVCADFLDHLFNQSYDLIISNPPYFQDAYKPQEANRRLARHNDNLNVNEMLKKTSSLLHPNGIFAVIIPSETASNLIRSAQESNLYLHQVLEVFGKETTLKRVCLLFKTVKTTNIISKQLVIRDAYGNYTEAYKRQTIEFHGKQLK